MKSFIVLPFNRIRITYSYRDEEKNSTFRECAELLFPSRVTRVWKGFVFQRFCEFRTNKMRLGLSWRESTVHTAIF